MCIKHIIYLSYIYIHIQLCLHRTIQLYTYAYRPKHDEQENDAFLPQHLSTWGHPIPWFLLYNTTWVCRKLDIQMGCNSRQKPWEYPSIAICCTNTMGIPLVYPDFQMAILVSES